MSSDLYRYVGTSTFPKKDGSGNWYILYLDEKQPTGEYRPMLTHGRNGSMAGVFVDQGVYDAIRAAKFGYAENVMPTFGPNNRILALQKA